MLLQRSKRVVILISQGTVVIMISQGTLALGVSPYSGPAAPAWQQAARLHHTGQPTMEITTWKCFVCMFELEYITIWPREAITDFKFMGPNGVSEKRAKIISERNQFSLILHKICSKMNRFTSFFY